jgi:hypothetical protein
LLTESQVRTSFSNLFRNSDYTEQDFEQAEQLIEELRPESPLRSKLATELKEIRSIKAAVN